MTTLSLPPLTLVIGGARSGKSAYAEALVADHSSIYLATADPRASRHDREMEQRIRSHQRRRGKQWETVEEPIDLVETFEKLANTHKPVLIDCLTLWVTNVMAVTDRKVPHEGERLVAAMIAHPHPIIAVTNEVGLGLVPETPLGRAFRDHAGTINQMVAAAADRVVFVTAGLPLILKDS
ncbi:MAG: bifunctional adenosylcobinamide kinase/adenosylcobinamide-phosphate guanylyltransferase [Magnetospiraceae bacterium]